MRAGRWRPAVLVACLVAAGSLAGLVASSTATATDRAPGHRAVQVKVLVLTMFEAETRPWLERRKLPLTVEVPGAYKPVRCDRRGLCVLTTGMGKSATAATMTAVLNSTRLDLRRAYFLSAGIAGTPPGQGTLGFAAWARWVVDYDLGHHLLTEEAPDVPYGYQEMGAESAVFRLDDRLVDLAYRLTRNVKLTDSEISQQVRSRYTEKNARRKPFVAVCDTVTGDNYWSGAGQSRRAQYITDLRTKGKGTYCTTQMEDNATATVLNRFGRLGRYLNLRTASNFDQPYPGQTVAQHLSSNSGGFATSVTNAYLVGSPVVDHLLRR
ncbi:purine-nucleoside phosphorylase [Actinomadura flavalba]|uniref:purine-nucleoside phosphorylase n=1 Tax=Actinomadura flavalba TaxID=1120938 RepID=UPI00036818DD|nr:purine nucleoside permease [Actinomadura flavalba]